MPALLLIPGLVFFGALVLVSLAQTLATTTKAQSEAQQSIWGFIGDALTGKSTIRAITTATRAAVSRAAVGQLKPVVRWFIGINALLLATFRTDTEAFEATASAVEKLAERASPKALRRASAPAAKAAARAQKTATLARTSSATTAHALTTYQVRTNKRLAVHSHAIDVTIPAEFGGIRAKQKELDKANTNLRERTTALEDGAVKTFDWIRTHPLSAVTGVFTAAVSIALARLGFSIFRCRGWQSLGRRLTCGMGALLEELIFTAVESFAVLDICDFANAAETLAKQFEGTLLSLVDVEDALVGCHGATRPLVLDLPAADLPPTNLGLPLAA